MKRLFIFGLLWTIPSIAQSSHSPVVRRHKRRRDDRAVPSHKERRWLTKDDIFHHHHTHGEEDAEEQLVLPTARIVGGTEVPLNRYPYIVSLQKVFHTEVAGGESLVFIAQKCAGTLIAEGEHISVYKYKELSMRVKIANTNFTHILPRLYHLSHSPADIILTAAHCADCDDRVDPSSCYDRIVLGRHDLRSYDEMKFVEMAGVFVGKTDGGQQGDSASSNSTNTLSTAALSEDGDDVGRLKFDRSEVRTHIHPLYRRNHQNGVQYDFALIQLPTRVYNETAKGGSLRPVMINSSPNFPSTNGEQLTIVGWGATDNPTEDSSHMSPVLREATVPYLDNTRCRKAEGYVGSTLYSYKEIIGPSMLCALSTERDGTDACVGDSGGPATFLGPKGDGSDDVQIGIVSFGVECGNPDFPGVYARIAEAYGWISETVCNVTTYPSNHFECDPSPNPSSEPSHKPSLRGTDSPSVTPTSSEVGTPVPTSQPSSLPSSRPPSHLTISPQPSQHPTAQPSTKFAEQIFLIPEKLERSGVVKNSALITDAVNLDDAGAASGTGPPSVEPTTPSSPAPSSSAPTVQILTRRPSEQPSAESGNLSDEDSDMPSSSSTPSRGCNLLVLMIGTAFISHTAAWSL